MCIKRQPLSDFKHTSDHSFVLRLSYKSENKRASPLVTALLSKAGWLGAEAGINSFSLFNLLWPLLLPLTARRLVDLSPSLLQCSLELRECESKDRLLSYFEKK